MPDDPSKIKLYVDWSGNGTFLEVGEDVSGRWLSDAGIVWERGRDSLRSFAAPRAGALEAALDNRDRLFSIENEASALYGKLEPGPAVLLCVHDVQVPQAIVTRSNVEIVTRDGQTLITRQTAPGDVILWKGRLDALPQRPTWKDLSVGLPAIGNLSRLKGLKVSTGLLRNITTDVALNRLLDEAGWPAGERAIQTGATLLLWWHLNNADAFEAARAILATEGPGASMYEDALGRFVFENRHSRVSQARSKVSQFTFGDDNYLQNPAYDPRQKEVINACEIEVVEREVSELGVIWEAGELIELTPNEVREFTVRAGNNEPFTNAQVPVSNNAANEVQTIKASGLGGAAGNMRLSFNGVQTGDLNVFSSQAALQYEIERLSSIGPGNIAVSGSFFFGDQVALTFQGLLANTDVASFAISHSLTGPDNPQLRVEETVKGGPPDYRLVFGSLDSITLDRTSGGFVTLKVKAGANGAVIEGLHVRAQTVPVVRSRKVSHSVDTSASQAKYGPRPPSLDFLPDIAPDFARSLADAVVLSYQWPRPTLMLEAEEQDAIVQAYLYAAEISDRVTAVESQTGIDGDYFIEYLRHAFDDAGMLTTQLGCEKALGIWEDVFIVGSAVIGTSRVGF